MAIPENVGPLGLQDFRTEARKRHITQQSLGDACGVVKATINSWACGWRLPSPEQRAVIAELIGLPEEELFTLPDEDEDEEAGSARNRTRSDDSISRTNQSEGTHAIRGSES